MARLFMVPTGPAVEVDDDPRALVSEVAEPAAGLPAEEPWAQRVGTWARAADEAAASVETAVCELRRLRVALLGGHRGAAEETAARLMTHLGALAGVLGEVHVGLDELAHGAGPGGAA